MPLPLAIILAITMMILWPLTGTGGIGILLLMAAGIVWYGYRHIQKEKIKAGQWIINNGILFQYLLASIVFLLILYMACGADIHQFKLVFAAVLLILAGYSFTMALGRK